MKVRALLAVTAAVMAIGAPSAGRAATPAQSACVCSVAFLSGNGPVGTLDAAQGTGEIASAKGFVPIDAGAKLPRNAQVRTGPFSSAELLVGGGCDVSLGASSLASLTMTANGLCVRKNEPNQASASDPVKAFLIGADVANGAVVVGLGLGHSVSH